ncbi:MAG: hypothetical protein GWN71_20055, partial [Gammaproteobacteria bacterium]|nr:hypothetical protein [Gemmatimonadota bacterium]NIU75776.1 hypothetical protein [Gammaproteobacteria bacterium]
PERGDAGARVATPLSIQSAGTEYVARLARLSTEAEQLTPAEREEARQVALAILYAATLELLGDSENDEMLEAAAQLIYSRRQAERSPGEDGTLWF